MEDSQTDKSVKVIGGGEVQVLVWTPSGRLVKEKKYVGDHSEIENLIRWKENKWKYKGDEKNE